MIEASRSFEHKGYATRRSHLAVVLPMSRDLRRVRAALTNPASNDTPLTALGTWLAVIAVILTAFGIWGAS